MLHSDHDLVDSEIKRAREIQERLKQIPNLMLLDGHLDRPKVPVFSFLIKCGNRFLHYNYVCALLNDVFGIQSRGGCQYAGPHAQMMLGMLKHNQAVKRWLVYSKDELLRPGVTRFSLPAIGTNPEQQEYVLRAIEWVAKYGWKFMQVYHCKQRHLQAVVKGIVALVQLSELPTTFVPTKGFNLREVIEGMVELIKTSNPSSNLVASKAYVKPPLQEQDDGEPGGDDGGEAEEEAVLVSVPIVVEIDENNGGGIFLNSRHVV
jgi:hypothetical protein